MKRLLTLLLLLAAPLMAANWGPYGEPLYDINGNFLMKNNTAGSNAVVQMLVAQNVVTNNYGGTYSMTGTMTMAKGYGTDTNMVFEPTMFVTHDALDRRLQAFATEKWYGTAETNVFLPGKGAMWTTEPTTQWVSTNALAAGTNLLGVYATTNIIYGNEITAQEFLFHFHVRYTGIGGPAVSVYGAVVAISADGSTTTTVDSTSIDVLPSSTTTYYEFDQRAHLSTNIVLATNSYIGVLWYGIRSGGVSANLFTAGGGGLGTSLRTGNISYSDGHVTEALSDGKLYGRKNAAWEEITGGSTIQRLGSIGSVTNTVTNTIDFASGLTAEYTYTNNVWLKLAPWADTNKSVDAWVVVTHGTNLEGYTYWSNSASESIAARYDFEGTAWTNDSCGSNNTATIYGTTVTQANIGTNVNNRAEYALALGGSGEVVAPDQPWLSAMQSNSISFWIKAASPSALIGIISKNSATAYEYQYYISAANKLVASLYGAADASISISSTSVDLLPNNIWTHVVIVSPGFPSYPIIYTNGSVMAVTQSSTGSGGSIQDTAGNVYIGGLYQNYFLNGTMDAVQISRRVYSASEVATLYANQGGAVGPWMNNESRGETNTTYSAAYSLNFAGGNASFVSGTKPTPTAASGAKDILHFNNFGTTNWYNVGNSLNMIFAP